MGIKKLFTFLYNNKTYKVYSYLNDLINDLELKKSSVIVGIDGNLYCYKYMYSYGNLILGFFNQIIQFLSNGIIPLYIFDGGTIIEKENTTFQRNLKKNLYKNKLDSLEENFLDKDNEEYTTLKNKYEKNNIRIGKEKILLLIEMLDMLNIPYIFSHGEGEYLAVLLNKLGIIDMLLTDDTDPILAGAHRIIKFYNNSVYYLDTTKINETINLSQEQFLDFCILLGTDYATFQIGIKPPELLEIIKKYSNIENIIENNIENNIIDGLNNEKIVLVEKIRNIYNKSSEKERALFIEFDELHKKKSTEPESYKDSNLNNLNIISFIDHKDINYYSNILLEFWDDFILLLKNKDLKNNSLESLNFKNTINSYIRSKKYNTKSIIKFLKNNVDNINQKEINNTIVTFDYLNTFGF